MTPPGPTSALAAQLGAALAAHRAATPRRHAARHLGITANTLRELEHAQANPTLARVQRLADALDLTATITLTPRDPS